MQKYESVFGNSQYSNFVSITTVVVSPPISGQTVLNKLKPMELKRKLTLLSFVS